MNTDTPSTFQLFLTITVYWHTIFVESPYLEGALTHKRATTANAYWVSHSQAVTDFTSRALCAFARAQWPRRDGWIHRLLACGQNENCDFDIDIIFRLEIASKSVGTLSLWSCPKPRYILLEATVPRGPPKQARALGGHVAFMVSFHRNHIRRIPLTTKTEPA